MTKFNSKSRPDAGRLLDACETQKCNIDADIKTGGKILIQHIASFGQKNKNAEAL